MDKKTLKKIGIISLITVAVWPALVLPFFGVPFLMACFIAGFWITTIASGIPFVMILVGLGMAFLAAIGGVASFHTDTAEASIQRARLLARNHTVHYYKPVRVGNYDPTWDQKRPYYLSNYPPR